MVVSSFDTSSVGLLCSDPSRPPPVQIYFLDLPSKPSTSSLRTCSICCDSPSARTFLQPNPHRQELCPLQCQAIVLNHIPWPTQIRHSSPSAISIDGYLGSQKFPSGPSHLPPSFPLKWSVRVSWSSACLLCCFSWLILLLALCLNPWLPYLACSETPWSA